MVKNYDDMLSRFHLIPERYGQTDGPTDGQTDRFAISISRVSILTRNKNRTPTIKGVFIAIQLYCTQLTQLNSVQPSQSCFCL